MRTRLARADVVGNDDAGCTRYQTYSLITMAAKRGSSHRAKRPMRSAAADGGT